MSNEAVFATLVRLAVDHGKLQLSCSWILDRQEARVLFDELLRGGLSMRMRMKLVVLLVNSLLLSQEGCGALAFNEYDHDQTREIFVGAKSTVSLPRSSQERHPRLKGGVIRPLGYHVDDSSEMDVFEFEAKGLGEDELRIAVPSSKDFVLHIKVKSASDEPTVHMHQP
jgi:hypothetical protein